MRIPVVGFDPSMRHWGIAEGTLDLETGFLENLNLTLIEPKDKANKQVRTNSIDMGIAEMLYDAALPAAKRAKAIFVEVPVGSQSASGMKAYGMCVGILGSMRSNGVELIEVTASEVKLALAGKKTASKDEMVKAGVALYPAANWPRHSQRGKGFAKGDIQNSAEHVADAIGAIHAGVQTPTFQQLIRLLQKV